MRICNTSQGPARLDGDELCLLDVSESLDQILKAGELERLAGASEVSRVAFSEAQFRPVVEQPGRFVIAGLNYRAHCEEIGVAVPEKLVFGSAPGTASHASHAPVLIPAEAASEIDYEGEIGLVIGADAHEVSARDAWKVVAGIVPLNDVSARDVQAGGTLEAVGRAKGYPTFKPHGPVLATPDEFADLNDIAIRTWVNGELRQEGNSGDMVFPLARIVEIVSARVALAPGDVICTGTPGGVAHGGKYPYLKPGDEVVIEVDGLPRLVNNFAASGE